MRSALFIDKDGTLIENEPLNLNPRLVRFTRHALPALLRLQRLGYALVVVSNQPALGEGRFGIDQFARAQASLIERLRLEGAVRLTGFYVCPHRADAGCGCRKPAPGLLRLAAAAHGLDLANSWMVGDILDDVEAGRRAGCHTVLLDVGNETRWHRTAQRRPDHRCTDLAEVAELVAAHETNRRTSVE